MATGRRIAVVCRVVAKGLERAVFQGINAREAVAVVIRKAAHLVQAVGLLKHIAHFIWLVSGDHAAVVAFAAQTAQVPVDKAPGLGFRALLLTPISQADPA